MAPTAAEAERIEPAEVEREDILTVDGEHFSQETVAIVTGAASGIGRATALALAGNGLSVVATDVDEEGLAADARHAEAAHG
ncbi:MAG: SDR family NAD(P)-dependent oxidoreductase, partial [Halanaeroarchaeum sp.]